MTLQMTTHVNERLTEQKNVNRVEKIMKAINELEQQHKELSEKLLAPSLSAKERSKILQKLSEIEDLLKKLPSQMMRDS